MEAIVAAEPDLVVVSSSGADSVADHYTEISARFPTVVVDYSKQDWRKLSAQLGEATGLESKAKKVTADFDQYVRDAKAKIKPPDGDVSIVSFNGAGGQNQAVGKREGPHAKLLEAMGFTVVDAPPGLETRRQKRSDFAFVTYENLAKAIKGKSVFLISASDKTVAGFLADPLLANLPAVQSKRVHSLGPTSFRIDYYSGRQIVDAVVKSFN
jgi:ferrienterobactin-binding periplasmic protein